MSIIMKKLSYARLNIFKGNDREYENFVTYEVPFQSGSSVLDALIWINENLDENLKFRYSCINANACKECMILINGNVEYACLARLSTVETTLEPLPNKKLLCDLVTDIVPPKEKL